MPARYARRMFGLRGWCALTGSMERNFLEHWFMRIFCFSCFFLFSASAYSAQLCQENDVAATSPTARFEQHNDGTLTDKATGLMWQRCLIGQAGVDCSSGTAEPFSWAQALIYPEQKTAQSTLAGYQDWRLPNIRELASIVELQCGNPAVNLVLFPNNGAGHLWSSSPYRFYDHYAWFLDFNDGIFIYGDRQDKKFVRLVRQIAQ
jgi:hypothetical protein